MSDDAMSDEKKFPPADPSPQHLLGLPPLSAFPYVESLDRPFDEKQFAVDMTMALEAKNAPVHPPITSEAFKKAFQDMIDRRPSSAWRKALLPAIDDKAGTLVPIFPKETDE